MNSSERTRVQKWIQTSTDKTLSFVEMCKNVNINLDNEYMRRLLDTDLTKSIVCTDNILSEIGIKGSFSEQQKYFKKLLDQNTHITYELVYVEDLKELCYSVNGWDFETLFMQLDTKQGREFKQNFFKLKDLMNLYNSYREFHRV